MIVHDTRVLDIDSNEIIKSGLSVHGLKKVITNFEIFNQLF